LNKKDLINYKKVKMNGFFVSYEKWDKRVKINLGEDFELVNLWFKIREDINGKEAVLEIRHNFCGKTFLRMGGNMKNTNYCPYCCSLLQASHLHYIFCILAEYFYPESEFEKDIGFKGLNGGSSKYDLYIPKYNNKNTLFEFQSKYHDNKKDFDKEKKNFAINKKYNFIAIDHRNVNIEKICKKYFNINKIPNFVYEELYLLDNKIDIKKIQKMLDIPVSIVKISKKMNISVNILYKYIKSGILKKNLNHNNVIYNKKKIIMLDLKGNYIDTFNSYYEILKIYNIKVDSIKSGKIIRRRKNLFCSYSDYINKNYKIPEKLNLKYKIKQLDKNNKIIKIYNSQKEVCDINGFDSGCINRAVHGVYKQAYGYIWEKIID